MRTKYPKAKKTFLLENEKKALPITAGDLNKSIDYAVPTQQLYVLHHNDHIYEFIVVVHLLHKKLQLVKM